MVRINKKNKPILENANANKSKRKDVRSEMENENTRARSSPVIQDTNTEVHRVLSTKNDIRKLRKEEAAAVKVNRTQRKSLSLKKASNHKSLSLLSFLISEETIRAAKIEDDKPEETNWLEELEIDMEYLPRKETLVTINEPDSSSSSTDSNKPDFASTSRKPTVGVTASKKVLSYLMNSRTLLIDPEQQNELLLGYRNQQTNEMQLAIVPADCYVIYDNDKPKGTFTIVVQEHKKEIDGSKVETKEILRRFSKEKFKSEQFDSKPFAGYINPSWPRKNRNK